jgi:glycosyltransferase involved in cell wall biosynthesis
MAEPFFSVVIPSLNEEKYLPKLLKCLTGQTFRNFETILVDGASDDRTVTVFKKYLPQLPSGNYFVTQKRNVGYQRNFGAGRARGEYLVFLDADVTVSPTFLEELHVAALKKKFIFATTWFVPDSQKRADKLLVLLSNLGLELAKGINKQFSGGYNTIIKKEAFHQLHGFREDMVINEDHDFALRAGKAGIEVVILKEPEVTFSMRRFRSEGSLSVLRKYSLTWIYNFMNIPLTQVDFEYPMGGHVHKMRRKKGKKLTKLRRYLESIEKAKIKFPGLK